MKKIGDYIVYHRDVCKIVDIKEKHFNNNDYYSLEPVKDKSLRIDVPINNSEDYIRDLITEKEALKVIDEMKKIPILQTEEKNLENKYRELLDEGKPENLIQIIKTTYLRNKNRIDNKKRISEKDKRYFDLAEGYLYNEIGTVLNMDYDETKNYIIDKLTNNESDV